jgi:biopolymer transport protein ExbB
MSAPASPILARHLAGAALACALLLAPAAAPAWWNSDWTARKPIHLDTSQGGAAISDPIGDTVVLVRLHAGNFRFEAAREDGGDLRFVAGDDKTPLKHHLERFDPLLAEALAWVRIPDLKPGARTDLWLYHGNPKAPPADDARGTWDGITALTWHLGERGQPPQDASPAGHHATTAGSPAEGALIGRGLRLEGGPPVLLPAAPGLAWTAGAPLTWSIWVRPAAAGSSGVLFARRDGGRAFAIGFEDGRPWVEVDGGGAPQRARAEGGLAPGTWHHLAVTAGTAVALWVDGQQVARLPAALPALATAAALGGEPPGAQPAGRERTGRPAAPGFRADVDELQIAGAERGPGFLRLAAISQGADPARLLSTGQDEESGGSGTNYFAILIKAVTIDGWVVIGLLAVMSAVSWLVMAGKATYLTAVERANGRFTEAFAKVDGDLGRLLENGGHLGEVRGFEASPLYRMYQVGAREIRKRTQGRRSALSGEAIEVVRASLDASLVREHQKLTQRMVLLTIAISGGPFLGLLGTVVGVMITFAAVAAAGDVNVNAIAPGIAAALVATVAGLGVAIPALFGYNWLLTRIKDVHATMQVFADEFVTRSAESYAESQRPERPAHPTAVAAE